MVRTKVRFYKFKKINMLGVITLVLLHGDLELFYVIMMNLYGFVHGSQTFHIYFKHYV